MSTAILDGEDMIAYLDRACQSPVYGLRLEYIFFKSLAGNMDERIGHSGPFSTNLVGFVAVVVTLNPK